MTLPHDPDDGWADLARELGVEPTPRPAATPNQNVAAEPAHAQQVNLFDEEAEPEDGTFDTDFSMEEDSRGEVEADDHENEGDEDDSEGADSDGSDGADGPESDSEGEGQDGDEQSPKKRRRRRQRRKKRTGAAGETAGATGEEEPSSESEDDAGAGEMNEEEELEPAAMSEPARDWSNWDVPSWDEIVAGLYRPGR